MKKRFYYLAFALVISLWSCKKSSDSQPTTTPTPTSGAVTIESSARVTGKINGVAYSTITDGTIENSVGSDKGLLGFPDTSTGKYESFFDNSSSLVSYFSVKKGTMRFVGSMPVNTAFKTFFNPASYPFSAGAANGIRITYYDNAGTAWSTDLGTMDQTGSSFVITDIKELTGGGYYNVKVKASFNCKLYDGTGSSKTFTEGIFIGYFENN